MTTPLLQALAIASATLVSEDLTCIAVGLLVLEGELSAELGITACAVGIYLGDLGLWLLGRLGGRAVLQWPWVSRRIPEGRLAALGDVFDARAGRLILASRFLPGTRLPLYVAAGALGRRPLLFVAWALLSVILWVPLIVLLVARHGDTIVGPLRGWIGAGGALVTTLALCGGIMAGLRTVLTSERRARIIAVVSRIWRWEFWPMWAFYPPVVAWVALLAARYRGFATLAAANPGFADGGFVGESKLEILRLLPPDWTLPAFPLDPGPAGVRANRLGRLLRSNGWLFPVVLKPDVGERGVGVRLVASLAEAESYLDAMPRPIIAQRYHPGPFEAGIFYYRTPGEPRGRIFSITDKRFPEVVGDGRSTLEELVLAHARYRMQARRFLQRFDARRRDVPANGERVRLALAGNHAQGTAFFDGAHLWTSALEQRVDEIARTIPGFYIGRFDVRYSDVDRFQAGADLAIVELNGATSESTNIYDPSRSLLAAYRTLFAQWSLVFRIGALNRARGYRTSTTRRLIGLALAHAVSRPPLPVSD